MLLKCILSAIHLSLKLFRGGIVKVEVLCIGNATIVVLNSRQRPTHTKRPEKQQCYQRKNNLLFLLR